MHIIIESSYKMVWLCPSLIFSVILIEYMNSVSRRNELKNKENKQEGRGNIKRE